MKIELITEDARTFECTLPYEGCQYVNVEAPNGHKGCPDPGDGVLRIYGGAVTEGYDTFEARAFCGRCHGRVGTLRVTVSTMFGIEEDRRVLYGRARVY